MKAFISLLLSCFLVVAALAEDGVMNLENLKVLVYTKNGKGYVHENIPFAVKCIQKLGEQHGFKTDVAETPTSFTEENLKQYSIIIFASTNNDVFDTDEQRLAFRHFILYKCTLLYVSAGLAQIQADHHGSSGQGETFK